MDDLSAIGLFAVTAMLVCYALEKRSTWYVLGFAGACAFDSYIDRWRKPPIFVSF
jgi:hypothetical protein